MGSIRSKVSDVGWRRIGSLIVVLAFFGLFIGTGGWRLLADAVAGWFEPAVGLHDEFEPAHRIHFLVFSAMIWTAVLGMLAQFRSPRKHVAGQLMALVPWVALIVAFALTDFWKALPMIAIMGSLVLLATLLHPAGRDLVSSISPSRVNRTMLVLILVAAVPVLAFSATQIGLQTGAIDQAGHGHDHGEAGAHAEVHQEHIDAGHFSLMAAFGFVVIGIGLLASLRQAGWWLPAWTTGVLVVYFGLASVVFPETASSAGPVWGVAAIAWVVAFVGAAELTQDSETPTLLGAKRGTPAGER